MIPERMTEFFGFLMLPPVYGEKPMVDFMDLKPPKYPVLEPG
jgi:hypothetical protein